MTFGRNHNLLFNGDAEQEQTCSLINIAPIRYGKWISVPAGSVGVMTVDSTIAEMVAHQWISSTSDDDKHFISQLIWNVGRCSFVAAGYCQVSFANEFYVPERYRASHLSNYSLYLSVFCSPLQNESDMTIDVVLRALNKFNDTVNLEIFGLYPGQRFIMKSFLYPPNTTHGSIEFIFNNKQTVTSESRQEPFAFCDNIYLSLELSSIAKLIQKRPPSR
ncbi:unnamed protein product [Rotaria sp. Silwood2]|nr:unnamed protein product [Rotaria sp. Silwood2]CAF4516134.1 unnamed protein product [Rotaria sp. Silwood2]